jgi:glycosyltransferase involved in cell wall biosynthesis
LRLLLVSHPPLASELGGAQSGINLGAALRRRGHDVEIWSPEPLPAATRWWRLRETRNQVIRAFVERTGPYDVVDVPAISASSWLSRQGALVVRSVQPELHYLFVDLAAQLRAAPLPRTAVHWLHGVWTTATILAGWRRARRVLCLGTTELAWMRRRFPIWRHKLEHYWCAPADADRTALRAVRSARPTTQAQPTRFLWLGRWSPHKGLDTLARTIRQRAASRPEDSFTLAGTGTRDLPELADAQARVEVIPTFRRDELPSLLSVHDAGLFTSTVEGWGLSLNEMLESGMPVYATDAGGVRDLRPYFPHSLRPFPPSAGSALSPSPLEDLESNGYYRHFDWGNIAMAYEAAAARAVRAA